MPIFRFVRLILFFLFLGQVTLLLSQEERILEYAVFVQVDPDRSIKVKEDIRVFVTGAVIKRGITRSLPRSRTFVSGKKKPIRYNIIRVLKNGRPEPFHTRESNGMEIMYLGSKNVFLTPGEYHYTIEYNVPNQVELLEEIDEIYWNAIGNEVQFPIEKASCMVKLPVGSASLQQACYTGFLYSEEQACTIQDFNKGNELFFQTTRPLKPGEGFTVGVGFEKGVVRSASFFEKYGTALLLGMVSLGLLVYFVTTWNRYGVDPPKPTPYPLFASPKGFSPASISYIFKESYRSNKVTASIINLAVEGFLRIDEVENKGLFGAKKYYKLTRLKTDYSSLFSEDRALMDGLFGLSDVVSIDGKYKRQVKEAYDAHQGSILAQHEAFIDEGNNRKFLLIPIIISFLTIIGAVYMLNRNGTELDGLGLILFSLVFIGLPVFILIAVFSSKARVSGIMKMFLIPFLLFFVFSGGMPLVMGLSELKGMIFTSFNGTGLNVIALTLFIPLALLALFTYGYLIKKPTEEKLRLQSEIEGFKMYLEMAEKDRINLLNPPDRTPEHFEAMLPFAFALGVEHKWSAIFKTILEQAAYQPNWSNNRYIYTTHHFSDSFSNSVVQSATPPSSSGSGGSGGGGFSGGGGGGGGVGGW